MMRSLNALPLSFVIATLLPLMIVVSPAVWPGGSARADDDYRVVADDVHTDFLHRHRHVPTEGQVGRGRAWKEEVEGPEQQHGSASSDEQPDSVVDDDDGDWLFNVPQVYWGVVRLHELRTGTAHSLELRAKTARDKTRLSAMEHHLPSAFQQPPHLFREESEVGPEGSDPVLDVGGDDDGASAEHQQQRWLAAIASGRLKLPTVTFNVSGGHLVSVAVVNHNRHHPPFTFYIADPSDMAPFVNLTSPSHSFTADVVPLALSPPFPLRPHAVEHRTEFEVVVIYHTRRLTTFVSSFTIEELSARRDFDGANVMSLFPDNATMGVHFLVQWNNATGTLGAWIRRKPPIPDVVFEVRVRRRRDDDNVDGGGRGGRLAAHGFTNVPPSGVGFSDIITPGDGLHEPHRAESRRTLVFTLAAHFVERPRPHYCSFEISDLARTVAKLRNRIDGEVLNPTAMDDRTRAQLQQPRAAVLPLRALLRLPAGSDYLSLELLQPRPLADLQVWIRDGDNETLLLEEEAVAATDHVEHWRRDVRHFGYRHAVPIHRPVAGNAVRIDVLYADATATEPGPAVLLWASHHGANVARVDIVRAGAAAGGHPSHRHGAAEVLGGVALAVKSPSNSGAAGSRIARNGVLAAVPRDLWLTAADADRIEWIRTLLEADAFAVRLAIDNVAARPFVGPDAPGRSAHLAVLKLALLVLSQNDPRGASVRHQALYRSLRECQARGRFLAPTSMINEIGPLLQDAFPHYVAELRARAAYHDALFRWLKSSAAWLFEHPTSSRSAWRAAASARRGSGGGGGFAATPVIMAGLEDDDRDVLEDAISSVEHFAHALKVVPAGPARPRGGGRESSNKRRRRADQDKLQMPSFELALVPPSCYVRHSDTPNAEWRFDSEHTVLQARSTIVAGEAISVDRCSAGAHGVLSVAAAEADVEPRRLDVFQAFTVLGTVPQMAVDAVDFPGGVFLRADDKHSRDGLVRQVCATQLSSLAPTTPEVEDDDDDKDEERRHAAAAVDRRGFTSIATVDGRLACAEAMLKAVDARRDALPATIAPPPGGSPLYARGSHLHHRPQRLLQAARRSLRQHRAWLQHDVATLRDALAARARVHSSASASSSRSASASTEAIRDTERPDE